MPTPNSMQPDQNRIVAFLAAEAHLPVSDVEELYEHERAELAVGAHIMTFLPIFAIRNVQEILRRRGLIDRIKPSATSPSMTQ
ncbi:MAG: DUF3562 domain-containing protein [Burkholderiaceae bacterium]|nr:DUF3562 domain-containing protein [Burkholderiaceae bacterium]